MSDTAPSGYLGNLPRHPEPTEIEIEFTNACNARCGACPRGDLPKSGIISERTLEAILHAYGCSRDAYLINRHLGRVEYPWITVSGGGEPLLHPHAVNLLGQIVGGGFPLRLITNGSRLNPDLADRLLETGINAISVSFWGIKKDEYEAAMGLQFETSLSNVEYCAKAARSARVDFSVTWVKVPAMSSSSSEIARFWQSRGIAVDMMDNEPWNRGNLVRVDREDAQTSASIRPDPRRRVWCADLFFTDAYTWQGDCILCCCNYFTSRPIRVGSIFTSMPQTIASHKQRILSGRPIPPICQLCEQPRRQQAIWLAGPWLDRIAAEERQMLTYESEWDSTAQFAGSVNKCNSCRTPVTKRSAGAQLN